MNGMNGDIHGNRARGVSVDRYPHHDDYPHRRDPYDSSGSGRSAGRSRSLGRTRGRSSQHPRSTSYYDMEPRPREERTIFKMERQWSDPNIQRQGRDSGPRGTGRLLPQPPGGIKTKPPPVVIPSSPLEGRNNEHLLEWIENERLRRTPVPGEQATRRTTRHRDNVTSPFMSRDHRDFIEERRTPRPRRDNSVPRHGTGRMLPQPPKATLPPLVLNSGRTDRTRKMPKPSSLDLRHPENLTNLPSRSTSVNFPRIDMSPSRTSNFLDGTIIIPSLPPSRARGDSLQRRQHSHDN